MEHMKTSTSRDFRIEAGKLKSVLREQQSSGSSESESEDEDNGQAKQQSQRQEVCTHAHTHIAIDEDNRQRQNNKICILTFHRMRHSNFINIRSISSHILPVMLYHFPQLWS